MPHGPTDCCQSKTSFRPDAARLLCLVERDPNQIGSSAQFLVWTSSYEIRKTYFQNKYGVCLRILNAAMVMN
ncbi:hypothetical protein FJTKL_15484 [Diaporthe vaccinii]|uniref:Uncharacterized protein n=1 Tax=Diaporthe vaccinii TaxID=105482 RepID=A0ABR4F6N1_9PEZI